MINKGLDSVPLQKISKKQKTKNWGKSVIDELEKIIHTEAYNGRASSYRKQVNFDLYNGKLDRSDFEYVVDPYGYKEAEFPANLQHYDIISSRINLLLGEEIKRPFNFKVINENEEAVSRLEAKKKELLIQMVYAEIQRELAKEGLQPEVDENGQPKTPEEIQRYMQYTYQDIQEKTANQLLEYLTREEDLQLKFNMGFKDALISSEEIYHVGIYNGDPKVRICNPLDISVVLDPDSPFIEDAQAIVEERYLTLASVIDQYGEELEPREIDRLESEYRNPGSTTSETGVKYPYSNFSIQNLDGNRPYNGLSSRDDTPDGTIRVIHVEWKSMRKIGFLTILPMDGEENIEIVDEDFEIPNEASKEGKEYVWFDEAFGATLKLEWKWINEYWEGVKIAEDIYVNIRPKPNQRRSMNNPFECKSGYVGMIYNARNSDAMSLVDRLKPYQYLYNIIYYRMELALAKSKGKAMLMDVSQIPSSEGWDVSKWMYYLDALGIAFINPHEEGKRGQPSGFNQFQAIDLTMGDYINQSIGLLERINNEAGEISGVSRQRMGQVQTSELVGNTERAVTQSSHITEVWFYLHNEVKRRVLEALVDTATIAWRKGKKINYILDDMSRAFLSMDPVEFDNTEFGIFVTNSSRDHMVLETARQLMQAAVQNGATLSEVISVMQTDSVATIKNELKRIETERQAREQQAQQMQGQQMQQLKQMEIDAQREKDQREDVRLDKQLQNKIDVAMINAESKLSTKVMDLDRDGVPDEVEKEKAEMQKETKLKELELKKEEIDNKKSIEEKKLALEKQKLSIEKAKTKKD